MARERDANGRFTNGHQVNKGKTNNPNGRPPKKREERYLEIARSTVTFKQWGSIVKRAADDAEKGDAQARKWLSDVFGIIQQKMDITSKGGPLDLTIREVIVNLSHDPDNLED